jgi:hypothetical protein
MGEVDDGIFPGGAFEDDDPDSPPGGGFFSRN